MVEFTPDLDRHYAKIIENEQDAMQFAVVNNNVASWSTTSNKEAVFDAVKAYLDNHYLFTPYDGLEYVNSTESSSLPLNWVKL